MESQPATSARQPSATSNTHPSRGSQDLATRRTRDTIGTKTRASLILLVFLIILGDQKCPLNNDNIKLNNLQIMKQISLQSLKEREIWTTLNTSIEIPTRFVTTISNHHKVSDLIGAYYKGKSQSIGRTTTLAYQRYTSYVASLKHLKERDFTPNEMSPLSTVKIRKRNWQENISREREITFINNGKTMSRKKLQNTAVTRDSLGGLDRPSGRKGCGCVGFASAGRSLGGGSIKRLPPPTRGRIPIDGKYPTETAKKYYNNPKGARITKASHFNLQYVLGHKIVFLCVARGNPLPHITWFKDGVELYAHKYMQLHEWTRGHKLKSKMEIDPASQADAGIYECHANNKFAIDSRAFRTTYLAEFN